MLCRWLSVPVSVRSSSNSTVQLRPAKNCFNASTSRRYRKGLCASSRTSDNESNTRRRGLTRTHRSVTALVISASSTSDG